MSNPTVPKRANQIPRSLPQGVGGGDGFGHHPKPVSGGIGPMPSDFPMSQRRARGAAGGQMQWDSRTETPTWKEIPRGKNLPREQYNPSNRERFPETGKKSRYKPGTLRIPTQDPPKPPNHGNTWKPGSQGMAKKVNGDIRGALGDIIKDQFRVDPTGVSDGRAIPLNPFKPPKPWGPQPRKMNTVCELGGISEADIYRIIKKNGGDRNSFVSVEIWDLVSDCGEHVITETVEYCDGKTKHKFLGADKEHYNRGIGVNISTAIGPSLIRFPLRRRKSGKTTLKEVKGRGFINNGDDYVYGPDDAIGWMVGYGCTGQVYIPSIHSYYTGNTFNGVLGHKLGNPPDLWERELGTKYFSDGSYGLFHTFDMGTGPGDYPNKASLAAFEMLVNLNEQNCKGKMIFAVFRCSKSSGDNQNIVDNYPDDDYDFDVDEDTEMGCKWQKDEISYTLPELKIGGNKVGGNSIQIDDGLIPLADFVCKAMEMMHKGLGLQNLDITEFDKVLGDPSKGKLKPASLSELVHWQFENVSSLVGLPSSQEIVTIDNGKKDFAFRNVQDALTFLYQQQKESDMDLKIIETYNSKTAQQLEAVTQIALRQSADLEMIIKELGIAYSWERKVRPSLYKHGMSDDDEKTGILELFKGGEVAYPIRIWKGEHDAKQIALRTNLYAEMAAQSTLTRYNTGEDIPGIDARKKMSKGDDESWKEWVKAVNIPEKGVISGVATPYIEEYEKGTLTAKNITSPSSALSVFMKPKKDGKTK